MTAQTTQQEHYCLKGKIYDFRFMEWDECPQCCQGGKQ